ncbi:MAG: MogA/MoaB family molybdenum cofactor biosynthesis protein [Deltaproteobacteria bacterium]|nr:MogA/MoaB family molybdenum cofactor biosynthesis protein [Deltaproteobacteria bacterium]
MEKIAAVLVASDSRSTNERAELSGPAAREALEALGIGVAEVAVVPDEIDGLADKLAEWSAREDIVLVLTSGGTGLGPRDVTPEATRRVIEREAPGIPEMLRMRSLEITPHAALSRAVAGVANRTLIVNLPGSPRAVKESIEFLAPALPHALETVAGRAVECAIK